MTTMLPSSTSTFDSIERLLVVGPLRLLTVLWSTLDTSWKMASLTVPFSLICGFTRRVRPTSLRSTVVKGLTVLLPVLLAYCPVTKGTFWPMTILASSLSSVSRLGVDSTLASPLFCRKLASAPR